MPDRGKNVFGAIADFLTQSPEEHAMTKQSLEPWSALLSQLRPYVRQSGDQRRPAWKIGARKLLDYLLVYIAAGEGLFEIDGIAYAAAPGDLFWIPPNTVHAMQGHPPSMDCPYLHFDLLYRPGVSHWDGSIPGGTLDLSGFGRRLHPPLRQSLISTLKGKIRSYTNERVGQLIREAVAEHRRAQGFSQLRLSGLVLEIVAEILRGRAGLAAEQHEHVPILEEAAAYIREHAHENLRVEEMAKFCELSPSRFRELFGRHFDRSPREYLRHARIRRAKEFMIGSPLNFTAIAQRCGFGGVHSFSRAFRETEGISPSEYRRCGVKPASESVEET
jgi:AraC-like DNA-binding protein